MFATGIHACRSTNCGPPPGFMVATANTAIASTTPDVAAAIQRGHVGRSEGTSIIETAPSSGRNTMRLRIGGMIAPPFLKVVLRPYARRHAEALAPC